MGDTDTFKKGNWYSFRYKTRDELNATSPNLANRLGLPANWDTLQGVGTNWIIKGKFKSLTTNSQMANIAFTNVTIINKETRAMQDFDGVYDPFIIYITDIKDLTKKSGGIGAGGRRKRQKRKKRRCKTKRRHKKRRRRSRKR